MVENNYRRFEIINLKNEVTDFVYFDNEKIMYHKFSNNVRGYDVVFVGGIRRNEEYLFESKKYVDVETVEDKHRRKEITDLLVDKKKKEKNREAVYFHDMQFYKR